MKPAILSPLNIRTPRIACLVSASVLLAGAVSGQVRSITIEEAIQLALRHNHTLQATRTTVRQSQAQEITANIRPNPTLFTDWEYLPFAKPDNGLVSYLHDNTEFDLGLSYQFERGNKRDRRVQAAKDATAVVRSTVTDNERTLTFQVAQLFVNVQLAESTLELAEQNLASFQKTVDVSNEQFRAGGISESDNLKVRLQLLQFETDVHQAKLARIQALSDLRQQLGYESIPADYDVAGAFDYQPVLVLLPELESKALQNRPDLRGADLGVTAANSQYLLAKANGKQDPTLSANYSHVNAISAATVYFSIPLALFGRNQGEIVRTRVAITQAEEQQRAIKGQVLTDVKDAFEALETSRRVVQLFNSGYLDTAQRNRDISAYAYQRGGASLLDFLDAERSYRSTQLGYRQAIAAYLLALEQLRQAVGARSLL